MPPKQAQRKRIRLLLFSFEPASQVGCLRSSDRRVAESISFGHLSPLSQLGACPLQGRTSTCQFRRGEATKRAETNINTRETGTISFAVACWVTRLLSPVLRVG